MTLPTSGPLSLNDIQTEFGGANPIGINEYYAGGSLVPAGTSGTYGAVPSSGAISIQNFYGTASVTYPYVENVFASYAYTGTGASQTITTGVDTLNGFNYSSIFLKQRTSTGDSYYYTVPDSSLSTNTTAAAVSTSNIVTAFTTTGFTLGSSSTLNGSGAYYGSSTFKIASKFLAVSGWTGNNAIDRQINHDLGSYPGLIIVRNNFSAANWYVWQAGNGSTGTGSSTSFELNTTGMSQFIGGAGAGMSTTQFNLGNIADTAGNAPNVSGNSYTAWVFSTNGGGFGSAGTDSVITAGRFVATTAGAVSLGYQPQWLMLKKLNGSSDWYVFDSSRGFHDVSVGATAQNTYSLNGTAAEVATFTGITPNATGFNYGAFTGQWLYLAVRKGLMKKPTAGTQVFNVTAATNAVGTVNTAGFPVDMQLNKARSSATGVTAVDRLRTVATLAASPSNTGRTYLTNSTATEGSSTTISRAWSGNGFQTPSDYSSVSSVYWNFRQAASFFDIVCYTGDGVDLRTVNHNLTVAPEIIIVKSRTSAQNGTVYFSPLGANRYTYLNSANGSSGSNASLRWGSTTPTTTQFTLGTSAEVNGAGTTYVAYLFASCAGVSKVGSYTGTGALFTVDCGFPAGARFVIIKRTDVGSTTGNWCVWDTARGMVAGTNPCITLNLAAAEANANSVYTIATGFQVLASPSQDVNTNGATYAYLAIS
jgi:hypothetical protein